MTTNAEPAANGRADAGETFAFQAEVSKLLEIVAHSLYSDKDIFLRELISNASDACDKLRYAALTRPELVADDAEFRVEISADRKAGTLTLADNGIGMSRRELIDNLGTIARSGTAAFLEQIAEAGKSAGADLSLIGQFGVGFYSAFMVADAVEVLTRRAGDEEAWLWRSDGKGAFTISPARRAGRGTSVTLFLNKPDRKILDAARIRHVVKTYSDHVSIPIVLKEGETAETLNEASALWTRPRSQIRPEQYTEFYRHVSHALDEPWQTLHWKAEGKIEYAGLLFIPSRAPFDLFDPERPHGVKLYVKRVFITDDCEGLVPRWLRFLRGIVDSEDLPLNISRETLQNNPLLARIRSGIESRVLSKLKKKAADAPEDYAKFWESFGAVIKEGLYEGGADRDKLFELARFRSTGAEGLVSLDDYLGRMRPGQDHIYYIAGEEAAALANSPQLEGFRARGVEVLLLSDPIDEFWIPAVGTYKGKGFKSVTRGGAELSKIEAPAAPESGAQPAQADGVDELVAALKLALKDAVKGVRASERLTESAVCLVADEGDLDMSLARLLKQHGRLTAAHARILELNPRHPLIAKLAARVKEKGAAAGVDDAAWLLLDQARILEGEPLPDPAAFARRMTAVMEHGLA